MSTHKRSLSDLIGMTADAAVEQETLDKMATYDSFKLVPDHSKLHLEKRMSMYSSYHLETQTLTICVAMLIGIAVGTLGVMMHLLTLVLRTAVSKLSFEWCGSSMCMIGDKMTSTYVIFMLVNTAVVLLAGLIIMAQPSARGSGVPKIKSNLNGTYIPGFLNTPTLLAKISSTILVVSTALPLGRNGPMIHIGAMMAKLCVSLIMRHLPHAVEFETASSGRFWMTVGAAAGVSVAFSAPLGGIIYAFEEVSSFWSRSLTRRTFICTVFTAITVMTWTYVVPCNSPQWCGLKELRGLVLGIGTTDFFTYDDGFLPTCVLVSILGGLVGALYNLGGRCILNCSCLKQPRWISWILVGIYALVYFSVIFWAPVASACRPCTKYMTCSFNNSSEATISFGFQYTCAAGEYNPLASLLFASPLNLLKQLLSREDPLVFPPAGVLDVGLALLIYLPFAVLVMGFALTGGSFIPSSVIGALLGSLIGGALPNVSVEQRGALALIGAASVLGGVTRMTLTLSTILCEITSDIRILPAVMLSLVISASVASLFVESIDTIQLFSQGLPFLPDEPPDELSVLCARDVMAIKVVTLPKATSVKEIIQTLSSNTHNGFPVVETNGDNQFLGFITRSQLCTLINLRIWAIFHDGNESITPEARDLYIRGSGSKISSVLSAGDLAEEINLSFFVDPDPPLVFPTTSLPHVYQLFHSVGVRHLPVINRSHKVIGIITRKDTYSEVMAARATTAAASFTSATTTRAATVFSSLKRNASVGVLRVGASRSRTSSNRHRARPVDSCEAVKSAVAFPEETQKELSIQEIKIVPSVDAPSIASQSLGPCANNEQQDSTRKIVDASTTGRASDIVDASTTGRASDEHSNPSSNMSEYMLEPTFLPTPPPQVDAPNAIIRQHGARERRERHQLLWVVEWVDWCDSLAGQRLVERAIDTSQAIPPTSLEHVEQIVRTISTDLYATSLSGIVYYSITDHAIYFACQGSSDALSAYLDSGTSHMNIISHLIGEYVKRQIELPHHSRVFGAVGLEQPDSHDTFVRLFGINNPDSETNLQHPSALFSLSPLRVISVTRGDSGAPLVCIEEPSNEERDEQTPLEPNGIPYFHW